MQTKHPSPRSPRCTRFTIAAPHYGSSEEPSMFVTLTRDGQCFCLTGEPFVQIATALNVDTTISTVLASQSAALNWLRQLARGETHLHDTAWR